MKFKLLVLRSLAALMKAQLRQDQYLNESEIRELKRALADVEESTRTFKIEELASL